MRRLRIYTRSCRQPVRAEAARWDGSAAFELATFGFPLEMMRITADYAVHRIELSPEEARESGAIACSESATATASRCTPSATSIPRGAGVTDLQQGELRGPPVEHTGELWRFQIVKEQSASGGVRRVQATLE